MEHYIEPHWHPHDVDLLQAVKYELASNYTSLLSRLDDHVGDNKVHVTYEEKDRWDNKADKVSLYDLEMRLVTKADRTDLIELQEAVAKIKSAVDSTDGENGTNGKDGVTETEVRYILGDYVTKSELASYATQSWVEQYFLKKADYNPSTGSTGTTVDLSPYATIEWVNEELTKLKQNDSGSDPGQDDPGQSDPGQSDPGTTPSTGGDTSPTFTQDEIDDIIQAVQDNLSDILDRERDAVKDAAREIIEEGLQYMDQLENGQTLPESMAWIEEAQAFIQRVPHRSGDGNSVTWSEFYQDYNQLKQTVNQLNIIDTGSGEIDMEQLRSLISTEINNDESITQLKSMYSLTNSEQVTLQWLDSGLYSSASRNEAFSDVFASGEDVASNTAAIAALRTWVDFESGTGAASLASRVSNLEGTQGTSSGYITSSTLSKSIGMLFSTNNISYDDAPDALTAIDEFIDGKVNSAYIYTAINSAGDTSAVIHADKIDMEGVVSSLVANQAFINQLNANQATVASEVQVGNSGGTTVSITASGNSAGMLVTSSQGNVAIGDTTSAYGADVAIIPTGITTPALTTGSLALDTQLTIGGVANGIILPASGVATFPSGLTAGSGASMVQIPNSVSGSFTTNDGKTVTVQGGIITSIT